MTLFKMNRQSKHQSFKCTRPSVRSVGYAQHLLFHMGVESVMSQGDCVMIQEEIIAAASTPDEYPSENSIAYNGGQNNNYAG
jgi:hypothetical protein